MKKLVSILFLVISIFAVSGCTKNYETVAEYATAMNEVKSKLGDYTIDATLTSDGKESTVKSYIRGDVWRTDISEDNGASYVAGAFSDGSEVMNFDYKTKIALSMPVQELLSKKGNMTETQSKAFIKLVNPVGVLMVWDLAIPEFFNNSNNVDETSVTVDSIWKFGEIVEKNNYKCRMLTFVSGNGNEVCISDKYGIAVYAKIFDERQKKTLEINVKNIDNNPIDENNLKLPEGIKKVSMIEFFKSLFGQMTGNSSSN